MDLNPTLCNSVGDETTLRFDCEDVWRYLENTTDTILWVKASDGTRTPIVVDALRELRAKYLQENQA